MPNKMRAVPIPLLLLAAFLRCSDPGGATVDPPLEKPLLPAALGVRTVASGLAVPLYLTAPAGDSRLFVVERAGRIRVIENGQLLPTAFLDVSGLTTTDGERGLLSMAFHPRYAQNGFFYVYYTDQNGDITIARYTRSSNANVADAASSSVVISIPHRSFSNHNGGLLAFGPDGMLYAGTGDGGGGGDPQGNGQNPGMLLGKLLRLDIDDGTPYAIPPDNPFVDRAGARPEIWALGLRNPWRFSFDSAGDRLYVADVGQNRLEEVSVAAQDEGGVNYGWNIMEANECYNAQSCDRTGLRLPVVQYANGGGACSITGGYVYRGPNAALAGIRGHYFYSDFCAGFLRSFRLQADGTPTDEREWAVGELGSVLSFGEDAEGELYILSADGSVYVLDGVE